MIVLKAEKRNKKDNRQIRRTGQMPAVFYGRREKATAISVDLPAFRKVLKEAGESAVISLLTSDGEKDALIKEVQFDPVSDLPRHADFYVFEKGRTLKVKVPLKFVGSAPAVKQLGGTLVKVLRELSVKAEAKNLPHEIEVEVSTLKDFNSRILAGELKLPVGVTLEEKPEEVVVLAAEAKEEPIEETPPDLSTVEVEKKGKKEEEETETEGDKAENKEKKILNP